ncbi:MAG TPA: LuxR C-terminal-related transcriptional regulator [Roseateles sp.]|nr:LuxR C-terminal-related transcriptional regulator [Roseateles sp.]
MSSEPGPVDDWVLRASAAAVGQGSWAELLASLASDCGADGVSLFVPDVDALGRRFGVGHGTITAGSIDAYMGYWRAHDPWNGAADSRRLFSRAGTVRHGQEFIDDEALQRTPFYNELSRPNEGGRLLSLKVCAAGDPCSPTMHLTLSRPLLRREGFDPQVPRRLRAFWPHLRGALYAYWALQQPAHWRTVGVELLDALPHGCWLLDAQGQALFVNRAATVAAMQGVRLQHCRVVGIGQLDEGFVKMALQRNGRGLGVTAGTLLGPAAAARRMTVHAVPVGESQALRQAWPQAVTLLVLDGIQADPDVPGLDGLARRYRLTPAECAVLEGLVAGQSVRDIAQARGLSPLTVRSQLRALFDKTDCRRQSALVRLALLGGVSAGR